MCYTFYLFIIPRAMYFVFNKSNMFIRLNLVANLMYIIYVNNTLPLATDLYMKLHTELGRLCRNHFQRLKTLSLIFNLRQLHDRVIVLACVYILRALVHSQSR